MTRPVPNTLARALRGFFTQYLPGVRGASPHTILSYRDSMALLLRFLARRNGRAVVSLDLDDLDPDGVLAFLEYLETERNNCAATRNNRLAAVHAFARYVATRQPEHVERCQRLLAIPFKRARQRIVEYLEEEELSAMLQAPDRHTADGRRDHALLLTLFNTGARVQEFLDIRPRDLQLVRPFHVLLYGKGRKERFCPLWPQTVAVLRALVAEIGLESGSSDQLFRNRHGRPLTRYGVRYLVQKYARLAQVVAPSLARKRVHPHTMRHTTAVHLLRAGVDLVSISHWLGHASIETTNRYAVVDLETKRAAIAKLNPGSDVGIDPTVALWRSDASILEWLEAL